MVVALGGTGDSKELLSAEKVRKNENLIGGTERIVGPAV